MAKESQKLRETLVAQSRPGRRTGAIMIVDENDRLVGIFTDSDLARLLEANRDRPFFFSVDLPEGNYNVKVTLGDRDGESATTVKAESRRLMLERVQTPRGEFVTRTFTVNIRNSRIAGGGQVKLKDRERGVLHWDDKLTLEFNDSRPCVCAVEITRAAAR